MLDKDLEKYMDYVYDGGTINNISSTIVKVENGNICIIRDGKAGEIIKKDFNF